MVWFVGLTLALVLSVTVGAVQIVFTEAELKRLRKDSCRDVGWVELFNYLDRVYQKKPINMSNRVAAANYAAAPQETIACMVYECRHTLKKSLDFRCSRLFVLHHNFLKVQRDSMPLYATTIGNTRGNNFERPKDPREAQRSAGASPPYGRLPQSPPPPPPPPPPATSGNKYVSPVFTTDELTILSSDGIGYQSKAFNLLHKLIPDLHYGRDPVIDLRNERLEGILDETYIVNLVHICLDLFDHRDRSYYGGSVDGSWRCGLFYVAYDYYRTAVEAARGSDGRAARCIAQSSATAQQSPATG